MTNSKPSIRGATQHNFGKRLAASLVLAAAVTIGGCDSGGPPLVKVSGKVTFNGAAPPARGHVNFQPLEVPDGGLTRSGRAKFGADGAFIATSFQEGDGLLPGKYVAKVSCDNGLPNPNNPKTWEDISLISPNYEPETITIVEGTPVKDLILDVPSK